MAPGDDPAIVRIRGKRRGCPAENWRFGKRRRPELQSQLSTLGHDSAINSRASSLKPRKRRPDAFESPLETLPPEILQEIFQYAGNVELAAVSWQVALKLSKSQNLRSELTGRLLEPVLNDPQGTASSADCAAATRLLNSRFMSWTFFKNWLKGSAIETSLHDESGTDRQRLWKGLLPSLNLLPPKKLFSPPFTESKVEFLAVLSQNITDIHALDAAYGDLAQDAILQAVSDGNVELVSLLLRIGARSSSELVRVAVADCGCEQKIVEMLIRQADTTDVSCTSHSQTAVDVLDPVLWQWAERSHQQGNVRGKWLMTFLKQELRRRESGRSNSAEPV